MTLELPARERYRADFERVSATLPGAELPWLARQRRHAIERFAALGLPTIRAEDWKYTNVSVLERQHFAPALVDVGEVTRLSAETLDAHDLGCAHRLVFVDGRYAPRFSRLGALPAPGSVSHLGAQLMTRSGVLEARVARSEFASGFEALNAALFADGAYVEIPAGLEIDEPIELLFVASAAGSATYQRNMILAAEGSRAVIIERYLGLGAAAYFTSAHTSIELARAARVTHLKLGQESANAVHVAAIEAMLERDAGFVSHSIALGGALVRNDIRVRLDGAGARCELNGLYVATGKQHIDHHTRVDHLQPNATSREFYKGVIDGAARAVFNGKVVVHKNAQHTDAQQTNRNLLLSDTAEVDTKPELEIYADDVKCSHGATVGQLDEEQMFYLRARGLDEAGAQALLTHAFCAEVLERIEPGELRAPLADLLPYRLPASALIQE